VSALEGGIPFAEICRNYPRNREFEGEGGENVRGPKSLCLLHLSLIPKDLLKGGLPRLHWFSDRFSFGAGDEGDILNRVKATLDGRDLDENGLPTLILKTPENVSSGDIWSTHPASICGWMKGKTH